MLYIQNFSCSCIYENMIYLYKQELIDYDFFDNKSKNTILFLHGWGGNKYSFDDSINLLKNKFNILRITLPTTDPTNSSWTLLDYTEIVELILHLLNIKKVIIICHSFGFRICSILNNKIDIEKLVVTGGAGLKKSNIFLRTIKQNNKILLSQSKYKYLYKKIASSDYRDLSKNNKITFKNIVNFNSKNFIKFACPILLFWGKNDKETPIWMAKVITKKNNAKLITTDGNHFTYLYESALFKNKILEFLCT